MLLTVYEPWIIATGPVVGLTLLAWWLSTARMWHRLRHGPGPDPSRETRTRFGLTYQQAVDVERAVTRGRALTDERERTAVTTLARERLEEHARRWAGLGLAGRALLGLAHALYAAHLVVLTRYVVSNEGSLLVLLVYSVFGASLPWVQRRGLRTTVRRNAGPPVAAETS